MIDDRNATKPRSMSFKAYKKMKYQMICDFCIELNEEEKNRFNSLQKEIEVDNFCVSMIQKYL